MSEFETNPEAAIRAELSEHKTNLANIKEQFAGIQDGDMKSKLTLNESERLMALAKFTKREIFRLLLELNDIDAISSLLEAGIASAVELEQEEGIPAYLEPIVEETLGFDVSTQEAMDAVDPKVFRIFQEAVNRYNLMTFESEEEEDDWEPTE